MLCADMHTLETHCAIEYDNGDAGDSSDDFFTDDNDEEEDDASSAAGSMKASVFLQQMTLDSMRRVMPPEWFDVPDADAADDGDGGNDADDGGGGNDYDDNGMSSRHIISLLATTVDCLSRTTHALTYNYMPSL